jgi:phosphoglycolate phosphatase
VRLYRLVIFDFDGTLADSLPVFLCATNEAAERYRFRRIEHGHVEPLRGMGAREVMRHVALPAWKVPLVTAFLRRRIAERAEEIALFDGVAPMLERLARGGVSIAIVSTNLEPTIRRVLGARLADLVSHYGCGASVFGKRPKLRRALAAAGVAPRDALCVGDEIRDLQAARAEGIAFGAVTWGFTRADALAALAPEHSFARVDEIADRLA